ncbi:MAG: GNAT family N-acetyltransferase [Pseudomonadota bacterium]
MVTADEIVAVAPAAIRLRRAGFDDIDALAAMYLSLYAAYDEVWPLDSVRHKVRQRLAAGCRAMLFEHDDRPIGAAVWIDIGDHVFLLTYVIDRPYRSQGLGAALFARLRDEQIGADREIRLETFGEHAPRFWRGCGFEPSFQGMRLCTEEDRP